jgi:hypothetical protein
MSQIRQAMQEGNVVVHNPTTRPLKRQYLDCIKSLQAVLVDLERAKMELAIIVPRRHVEQLQNKMKQEWNIVMTPTSSATTTPTDHHNNTLTFTLLVDPSMYRQLDELCKSMDGCQLQILQQVVMNQDDMNLEDQIEQHDQQQQQQQLEQQRQLQQQQQQQADGNRLVVTSKVVNKVSDLSTQLDHQLTLSDDRHDQDDHDDDDDDLDDNASDGDEDHHHKEESKKKSLIVTPPPTKKTLRQNNKKSKKAKRREKEDLLERQARLEQERQRRQDRQEHLQPPSSSTSMNYDGQDSIVTNNTIRSNRDGRSNTTSGALAGATTTGASAAAAAAAKSCNTCGGAFVTAAEYRAHFKSDWHRFNQKLKLQGKGPITEQEFMLCDADMC